MYHYKQLKSKAWQNLWQKPHKSVAIVFYRLALATPNASQKELGAALNSALFSALDWFIERRSPSTPRILNDAPSAAPKERGAALKSFGILKQPGEESNSPWVRVYVHFSLSQNSLECRPFLIYLNQFRIKFALQNMNKKQFVLQNSAVISNRRVLYFYESISHRICSAKHEQKEVCTSNSAVISNRRVLVYSMILQLLLVVNRACIQ